MFKRPAQHAAATFLAQRGMGILTLLLVIFMFPILMLLAIGVKVGIVLGIHFLVQALTGSWVILNVFSVLTAIFVGFGFISRVAEFGRYYGGLHRYVKGGFWRTWYSLVFAVDFLITDMIMLTAAALLAFVYWMAAAQQSYFAFYQYLEPFLGLSILGGLLQILFTSYYLTHPQLRKVYAYATRSLFLESTLKKK